MGQNIKIKRGLDINLEGSPSNDIYSVNSPATFAIKPTDIKGLVPKMNVKQGDEVKAGIMDYYKMQNIQADTDMRDSISKPGTKKK